MNLYELKKDIDWTDTQSNSTAYLALTAAMDDDPMMGLFDESARRRLVSYLVEQLSVERTSDGNPLSVYGAGTWVQYRILPNSIYSVFGTPLASHVGYLVQRYLYPYAYAEAGGKSGG